MTDQTCRVCEDRGVMPGQFYGAQQAVVTASACQLRTGASVVAALR